MAFLELYGELLLLKGDEVRGVQVLEQAVLAFEEGVAHMQQEALEGECVSV